MKDILERIARFTPEQLAIYKKQLQDRIAAMNDGQPWVRKWLLVPRFEWNQEAIEWLRSRPRAVQELIVRFPPNCLVRAKPEQRLMVPAPGTFGLVASWSGNGLVAVVQSPTAGVRCQCEADWLELAACRDGQSGEDVRAVLGWA